MSSTHWMAAAAGWEPGFSIAIASLAGWRISSNPLWPAEAYSKNILVFPFEFVESFPTACEPSGLQECHFSYLSSASFSWAVQEKIFVARWIVLLVFWYFFPGTICLTQTSKAGCRFLVSPGVLFLPFSPSSVWIKRCLLCSPGRFSKPDQWNCLAFFGNNRCVLQCACFLCQNVHCNNLINHIFLLDVETKL